MMTQTPPTRSEPYSRAGTRACPQCKSDLFRVPRRPIDRLTSLFVPVRRFRCQFFSCHWEGNLPAARKDFAATDPKPGNARSAHPSPFTDAPEEKPPFSFVLSVAFIIAGIVGFTTSDLLVESEPEAQRSALSSAGWP